MDAGALLDLLGNQNRRRILRLISRKPCYVTEISEHLGVSPKAVIDHLRKLEEAGLIESRTDDQRRKYFHIARNLRLEVTLAPYGFATKSAYPASPSLDLSTCQYLSLSVSGTAAGARDGTEADGNGSAAIEPPVQQRPEPDQLSDLAEELDQLEDLERELSLAQRWVQGRIAGVLETLADVVDEEGGYVDAEIIASVARGVTDPDELSRELEVPVEVVEDCLGRLSERGVLDRVDEGWQLAT